MYINFWYPVFQSSELREDPRKVRMLGHDFVVFRDSEGQAHCLSNTCVHRGGSLADGLVKGDCIQCPYHGWQFDGDGECRKIPSLGADARIPGRTHVDAYPVEEKYGLLFAFLGDLPEDERPPIMPIDEFGADGWRHSYLVYEVAFNYERSIENGLDPAHNEFVHPTHGFSGENEDYSVRELRDAHGDWGYGFFSTFRSPAADDPELAKMKQASDSREAGSGHHGPNHLWTHIEFAPDKAMHQYMFETPIDEVNTRIFLINMRNTFLDESMDERINTANWTIAEQDITVLNDLHPVLTPPTNTKEFMVPADRIILLYREKLKEWDGMGWRIDVDAVNRTRRRTAFAIPGPARRQHASWVIDSVPLVSAETAAAPSLRVAAD